MDAVTRTLYIQKMDSLEQFSLHILNHGSWLHKTKNMTINNMVIRARAYTQIFTICCTECVHLDNLRDIDGLHGWVVEAEYLGGHESHHETLHTTDTEKFDWDRRVMYMYMYQLSYMSKCTHRVLYSLTFYPLTCTCTCKCHLLFLLVYGEGGGLDT